MPLRRLIFLSSLVLAVAAISPAATLGAANGTDRPVTGTSTGTVVIDLATGAGSGETSGQLSHLGRITSTVDVTSFTLTGPDTFSFTGAATDVTANGDKLFTTGAATGTMTPTGTETTTVFTITGGTGRFADASGTGTLRTVGVIDSIVGSIVTQTITSRVKEQISYPPETKITKGAPKKTHKTKLKFKFTSNDPGAKFQCKLDKKAFKSCKSPQTLKNLDQGKHTFAVRAIDADGQRDPTPAKGKFKIVD